MSRRFYAGIGSRKTPPEVLDYMIDIASRLAVKGWILRSGGAAGADTAFEQGCTAGNGEKEIWLARDALPWAYEEAVFHIPANRPPFKTWKEYVQSLVARNMMQVRGRLGDEPVEFIVCWTMADIKDGGGTGYAMRCAQAHGIPVYSLNVPAEAEAFEVFLEELLLAGTDA